MTYEWNIYLTGDREVVAKKLVNLRALIDGAVNSVQTHQENQVSVTIGSNGTTVAKFEPSAKVPVEVGF